MKMKSNVSARIRNSLFYQDGSTCCKSSREKRAGTITEKMLEGNRGRVDPGIRLSLADGKETTFVFGIVSQKGRDCADAAADDKQFRHQKHYGFTQ